MAWASQAAARSSLLRGTGAPLMCDRRSPTLNFCFGCNAFHFCAKPAHVMELTTAALSLVAASASSLRNSQTSLPRLCVGSATSRLGRRMACNHCCTASPSMRP
eukprot:2265029-Karenia_brevis.AAC.1